jgi:hypothetical protein
MSEIKPIEKIVISEYGDGPNYRSVLWLLDCVEGKVEINKNDNILYAPPKKKIISKIEGPAVDT